MLDIKLIREKPEFVRENLKKRNDPEKLKLLEDLIKNDKKWRDLQTEINKLRQKRNEVSIQIAKMKKEKSRLKALKCLQAMIIIIKTFTTISFTTAATLKNGAYKFCNPIYYTRPPRVKFPMPQQK